MTDLNRPMGPILHGGPGFNVGLSDSDGATVVHLTGELDLASKAQLRRALAIASSTPGARIVVDASQLTFIAAAGLGVLVDAHNGLVRQSRRGLVVRGASGIVRRAFEITQLTGLLDSSSAGTEVLGPFAVDPRELDMARQAARLSVRELFIAYFALGGTADFANVTAHLSGRSDVLDSHQRDVAVHAVNERLIDLGRLDCLLSYAGDLEGARLA